MQLVFSNSSINTPAANAITHVSYYTFTHMSTLNYLLNAIFFHESLYIGKVFPRITRTSCNHETFPPWTICIIQYVWIGHIMWLSLVNTKHTNLVNTVAYRKSFINKQGDVSYLKTRWHVAIPTNIKLQ